MKKSFQMILGSFMVLVVSIISSCESHKSETPLVDPNTVWHLSTDIQPIFTSSCSCHGPGQAPDLREGFSHQALTSGGYVNLPAESSELYTKITTGSHISRSTDAEKLKILYWIEQGAEDN